jgi:hypothetical protein
VSADADSLAGALDLTWLGAVSGAPCGGALGRALRFLGAGALLSLALGGDLSEHQLEPER